MSERKIKKMSIRELAFALTQHADDLQIFANGVSEDAADDFAQTEASIMEIIYELYSRYGETGIPMDRRTQRHLDDIRRRIAEIRESMFDEETEELTGQSREVVKNDGKFLKAFFAALTGAAAIGLDAAWYDKISQYGIFGGKTIRQIMDRIASGDVDRIYTAAADGLQNRKSLDEIRESVRKEMEKTARFMKSEIVSVLNGSANDAALAFAAANRTKLMYCAVLDDRVCEECASRDGEIYEFDDDGIPSVPRHNNCRCRLIPVADEDESNRKLAMPFREYLRSLPKAEQKKRLGAAKYDLLKSGQYQLKAYEPPNGGQRLSMDELKARDKELFPKSKTDKYENIMNGGNFHVDLADAIAAVRHGFDVKTVNNTVCHFGEYLYKKYVLGERKDGATPNRLIHLARAVEAVKNASVSVTELSGTNPPQTRYVHRLEEKKAIVVFVETATDNVRSFIYTNKQLKAFLEKYK